MNIIIVDDELVSLTVLKQLVEKLPDCCAQGFTDASAALVHCEQNDPDLVLVDYMMPDLNGTGELEVGCFDPGAISGTTVLVYDGVTHATSCASVISTPIRRRKFSWTSRTFRSFESAQPEPIWWPDSDGFWICSLHSF